MKKKHEIAVVVEPCFGARLPDLAKQVHVWICASDENSEAVRSYWDSETKDANSFESGATEYQIDTSGTPEDWCCNIVPTVDLHHGEFSNDPPWSSIRVYGTALTDRVRSVLVSFGASHFKVSPDGFIATREPVDAG